MTNTLLSPIICQECFILSFMSSGRICSSERGKNAFTILRRYLLHQCVPLIKKCVHCRDRGRCSMRGAMKSKVCAAHKLKVSKRNEQTTNNLISFLEFRCAVFHYFIAETHDDNAYSLSLDFLSCLSRHVSASERCFSFLFHSVFAFSHIWCLAHSDI